MFSQIYCHLNNKKWLINQERMTSATWTKSEAADKKLQAKHSESRFLLSFKYVCKLTQFGLFRSYMNMEELEKFKERNSSPAF